MYDRMKLDYTIAKEQDDPVVLWLPSRVNVAFSAVMLLFVVIAPAPSRTETAGHLNLPHLADDNNDNIIALC
jgi:hypothetical protein